MNHAYVTNDAGVVELHIYYGLKEVTFDESRLFPFGETLVRQSSFVARDATTWGPGYEWAELQPLLEALLEEEIIRREEAVDDFRGGGLVPSQLRPSECKAPRTWSAAECEGITQDLAGQAVEIGHLEAILSVYRIAHPALDGDDRQVGEANVFPPRLRLERETEWRVCQYSGSRYRDESPMNVTALKAMIKHWKPIMATLLEIRAAVRQRIARTQTGWTVGDVHTLSCVVLAIPAFQLMKGGGSVPQRPLHPVLSNLFRIVDGVRMTTHEMLFLSAERTRSPDEPISVADVYDFAERNGVFLSGTGVCAGPKALIEELLTVFFDGVPVEGLEQHPIPAEVRELLDQLPEAIDYAFYGMQVWGVARSAWLAVSRAYKSLLALFEGLGGSELGAQVLARLRKDWRMLGWGRIADDYERDVHDVVYADAYEQSWRGLRTPVGASTYAERITPLAETESHRAVAAQIRSILVARLASHLPDHEEVARKIAEIVKQYLREEQAILGSTTELEAVINTMLDRPAPTRPLSIRDLRVNYTMLGVGFPYLFDTLGDELGVQIESTARSIEVSEAQPES
jgi:hypothetical protein